MTDVSVGLFLTEVSVGKGSFVSKCCTNTAVELAGKLPEIFAVGLVLGDPGGFTPDTRKKTRRTTTTTAPPTKIKVFFGALGFGCDGLMGIGLGGFEAAIWVDNLSGICSELTQ